MLVSKSFECSFSNQNVLEHILINLLHLKYCIFFFFFVKQRCSSCAFHFSFDPKKSNRRKKRFEKKNLFFFSKKLQQKLSTRQINKFDYSLQKKKVAAAEFGFQHFCRHFCFIADNLYARKKNDTTEITMYTVCFIPLMFFFPKTNSLYSLDMRYHEARTSKAFIMNRKKRNKIQIIIFFCSLGITIQTVFFSVCVWMCTYISSSLRSTLRCI